MRKFLVIFVLFLSLPAVALTPKEKMEEKIAADVAWSLSKIKSPEDALKKIRPRLQPQELKYLEGLVRKKMWVEMPVVTSEKNTLKFKFSNDKTLTLKVVNYWTGEYELEGYKLALQNYPNTEERIAYLRRVIQSKVLGGERKGAALFSLIFPSAHADLTCNSLVSSGCLEVSMATSLWLMKEVSEESPLKRCGEVYYFNKDQDITKKCLAQFDNSPTLTTIQELSEVLVEAPGTQLEITCNSSEGPNIHINGSEVMRLGNGFDKTDYSLSLEQDPELRLVKLPELAIRCCKKSPGDPLAGQCEEFVNHQLGSGEARRKELSSPNLRIRGEEVKGVR